jgi:hypothetical protein
MAAPGGKRMCSSLLGREWTGDWDFEKNTCRLLRKWCMQHKYIALSRDQHHHIADDAPDDAYVGLTTHADGRCTQGTTMWR